MVMRFTYGTAAVTALLLGAVVVGCGGGNSSPASPSTPAPVIASVSPATGTSAGGTSVTLTGSGFVTGATVTFGGTAATSVSVVSATSITAVTPAHAAGSVAVIVTNANGQSGTLNGGFYVPGASVEHQRNMERCDRRWRQCPVYVSSTVAGTGTIDTTSSAGLSSAPLEARGPHQMGGKGRCTRNS